MMEWYHWIIGAIVLLIIRDILALLFGWGRDENGNKIDVRDPEGGTFGKMLNWHRREVVKTSIRPDLGEDETTASGYVELSTVIRKGKK